LSVFAFSHSLGHRAGSTLCQLLPVYPWERTFSVAGSRHVSNVQRAEVPRARGYLQSIIEPGIIEAVGDGPAKIMLEAFASVVMSEKHKIESQGASRA
jgi:hypothetical protein